MELYRGAVLGGLLLVGACVLSRAGSHEGSGAEGGAGGASSVDASTTAATGGAGGQGGAGGEAGAGGSLPLAGWSNRKPITLTASEISAPASGQLNDFPVLISLSADPDLAAIALPSGQDIRFTQQDGVTLLDHEIEAYSAGTLAAWVRIPALSDSDDTTIYLYFGNDEPPAAPDGAAVWNSQYEAVWHFNDDPTQGDALDATANGLDGTPSQAPASIAGVVAGALDFDGVDDGLSVPELNVSNRFTVSLWVHRHAETSRHFLICNTNTGFSEFGWRLFLDNVGGPPGSVSFETGNGNNGGAGGFNSLVPLMTWTHLAVVVNRNNGEALFYVDGSEVGGADNNIRDDFAIQEPVAIGRSLDGDLHLDASLDELRISTTRRSAEWIATSYRNQRDPSAFAPVGPLE